MQAAARYVFAACCFLRQRARQVSCAQHRYRQAPDPVPIPASADMVQGDALNTGATTTVEQMAVE